MTHERFKEFLRAMEEVHSSKNQQYAGKNEHLSNLKMCEAMGIPAWKGVVTRMTDKLARLMNLSNSEGSEIDSGIRDTFIDMAVYMYDAFDPKLMLLGGVTGAESDRHDWQNLFGDMGLLRHARGIGLFFGFAGGAMMLAGSAWAGLVLKLQHGRLSDSPFAESDME